MAETMKPNQLTRKVGPLPVYAWALLLIAAYLAYNHFKNAGATNSASTAADTTNSASGTGTYVPGFDAASGGINGAYTPGTGNVYNYYYGDQNAAQAGGGGTSNGTSSGGLLFGNSLSSGGHSYTVGGGGSTIQQGNGGGLLGGGGGNNNRGSGVPLLGRA